MSENESPGPPKRRVVVAEDESLIRIDIVETLQDNGFEVVAEAADGERVETRPGGDGRENAAPRWDFCCGDYQS